MRTLASPLAPRKGTNRDSSTSELLDYLNILVSRADGNASATARASVQRVFDKIVERLG